MSYKRKQQVFTIVESVIDSSEDVIGQRYVAQNQRQSITIQSIPENIKSNLPSIEDIEREFADEE